MTNWIFSLQKSISKLIFAGYTGSKNQVRNRLKIQFVELDFSKLIFQKSSMYRSTGGLATKREGVRFCIFWGKMFGQTFRNQPKIKWIDLLTKNWIHFLDCQTSRCPITLALSNMTRMLQSANCLLRCQRQDLHWNVLKFS